MGRAIAKVFVTGRSQAIRIPKEFRFECEEVYIERHGDQVILTPKPKLWEEYFVTSKRFTEDFPDHVEDELPEEREALG
jgi:antitoxin VapB